MRSGRDTEFKCLLFNPNSSCAATLRFRFGGMCPRAKPLIQSAWQRPEPASIPEARYLELNQGRRALVATGLSANSAQKQIEVRDGLRPEDATKAARDALACRYGNGPITGRIRAITATG